MNNHVCHFSYMFVEWSIYQVIFYSLGVFDVCLITQIFSTIYFSKYLTVKCQIWVCLFVIIQNDQVFQWFFLFLSVDFFD